MRCWRVFTAVLEFVQCLCRGPTHERCSGLSPFASHAVRGWAHDKGMPTALAFQLGSESVAAPAQCARMLYAPLVTKKTCCTFGLV